MNEIPLSFFIVLVIVQLVLMVYAFIRKSDGMYSNVFAGFLSGFLGFLNANMILNGNVVVIQSDGSTYSYIPVQSLPVHYFLLGLGVIMVIVTVFLVFGVLYSMLNKKQESALGEWGEI